MNKDGKATIIVLLVLVLLIGAAVGGVYFMYKDKGGFDAAISDGIIAVRKLIGNEHIHDYTDWDITEEPDCNHQGKKVRTCKSCGYVDYDFISPTEHDYETVTVPATCTVAGSTTQTCKICGHQKVTPIDALGHDIDENATCTDRYCAREGCDYMLPKTTDHSFGDWRSGEPAATCTTGGKQIRTCTLCNTETEERDVGALGHDMSFVSTTATCTAGGDETRKCSRCNETEVVPVGPLGHDFNDNYDCHDRTCKRCHVNVPATGEHDYRSTEVPYGCITQGYTEYTCKNCGYSYRDDYVDSPYGSHDYGAWSPTSGGRKKVCSRCGDEYIELYHGVNASSKNNKLTITGTGNYFPGDNVTLTAILPDGYKFNGWYEGIELLTLDTTYDFVMDQYNHSFEAKWGLMNYTITYHTDDGALDSEGPHTYNTVDGATLPTATKEGFSFVGWYLDDEFTEPAGNLQGVTGNVNLYAYFTTNYVMTFTTDGTTPIEPIVAPAGAAIEAPALPVKGYTMTWYSDSTYTTPYSFTVMPDSNTEIFGKWHYVAGGFSEYEDEFRSDSICIDSNAELCAYIEFLCFYRLTDDKLTTAQKNLTYSYLSTKQQKSQALTAAHESITYPGVYQLSYESENFTKICISEDTHDTLATLTAATEPTYSQYGYIGYKKESETERAIDFNAFAVSARPRALSVTTSDDLVYALEHGYAPSPVADSAAEDMYDAAKVILRKIITDEMTDTEKVRAIYEWLIMETCYDYAALEVTENWKLYDAYYLEGVFNNRRAVCDGISKAFVVMCNTEGIPSVRVTGDTTRQSSASGHAWNKVQLNGKWYVVDATWGSSLMNISEVGTFETMSYNDFLITDAQKAARDCTADNYADLVANNVDYDYYTATSFTYSEDGGMTTRTFDLCLDTVEEASNLLYYYHAYATSEDGVGFDSFIVCIKNNTGSSLSTLMQNASNALYFRKGLSLKTYITSPKEGSTVEFSLSLTIN